MFSRRLAAPTVAGALALAGPGRVRLRRRRNRQLSGPIKIGVVVPLTGPFAPLGIGDKAAIEQEVKTINDAGGVLGRDLEVTIKDDKTDVPQSVTEYNQLAADKSYTAILSSSFVSASTAIGPSAESNKIPTIALGPVSDFADGSNKYAFTCVAIPELYAQAMVDYLAGQGYKSLAIGYTGQGPLRHRSATRRPSRPRRRRASTSSSTSRSTSRPPTSPADHQGQGRQAGRVPGLGGRPAAGDHHQAVRRRPASRC